MVRRNTILQDSDHPFGCLTKGPPRFVDISCTYDSYDRAPFRVPLFILCLLTARTPRRQHEWT